MKRLLRSLSIRTAMTALGASLFLPLSLCAQQSLSWDQIKARFEAANPTLKADAISVEEMKAAEITAFFRPNPQFTFATDGTQIAPHNGVWQPFIGTLYQSTFSYLHERDHKRDLRLENARQGTQISASQHEDLNRTLLFTLRSAFVQVLQAKTVLDLAKNDIEYYDKIVTISRDRFNAGDISQIDLDRIELLRVQYEVEIETATVNLRTAKIQLIQLLNDNTAVDQFDVIGPFEWNDALNTPEELHRIAIENRPDLRAAIETIKQSEIAHKLARANGSTDPTLSAWYTYNPSFNNPNDLHTLGLSVNVPLRIFDRNQGEKKRTLLDIERKERAADAARALVFNDVDSAYERLRSNIALLKPYKEKYRDQSKRVRDTVTYSYQNGGASLMDFLNAQSDFRIVQLAYVQLVGSYLTAAGQLNLALGREAIQ